MSGAPLSVLVASGDGDFRRLAGAAISRAGHDVRTVTNRPQRIERLLRHHRPDVLVVDDADVVGGALMEALGPSPGERPMIVLVADGVGDTPVHVVDKWGP